MGRVCRLLFVCCCYSNLIAHRKLIHVWSQKSDQSGTRKKKQFRIGEIFHWISTFFVELELRASVICCRTRLVAKLSERNEEQQQKRQSTLINCLLTCDITPLKSSHRQNLSDLSRTILWRRRRYRIFIAVCCWKIEKKRKNWELIFTRSLAPFSCDEILEIPNPLSALTMMTE